MNLVNNNVIKIDDLSESTRSVDIIVKIVSIGQLKNIVTKANGREHILIEALVGDRTGCAYLNFWDDPIKNLKNQDIIKIEKGYISMYRGALRLNIGRNGKYKKLRVANFENVNLGNNVSSSRLATYPPLNLRSKYSLLGLQQPYQELSPIINVD